MRHVCFAVLLIVTSLAGTAALAETCPTACPPPVVQQCPQPCPPAKPVCPTVCPAPRPACPPPAPCPTVCPVPRTNNSCNPCVTCPKPCPTVCPTTCPKPCPTVCPTTCPKPCPTTCPTVCPKPVQVVCPPCPPPCGGVGPKNWNCPPAMTGAGPARPCGVGAGPVPALADLCDNEFDLAFVQSMYQHHNDIMALTSLGISQACDRRLRDLSGKIRYEQTRMNQKLAMWWPMFGGCGDISINYERPESDIARLKCLTGSDFDCAYAAILIAYLEQSDQAAQLGMCRACRKELRDQSRIVSRTAQLSANALRRWSTGVGAGPCSPCGTCPPTAPLDTCPARNWPVGACQSCP